MSQKIFEEITNQILTLLEKGEIPWKKPWLSQMPQNYFSKKDYKGINAFLLNALPYSSPYWLTFKQANDNGLKIKKGSKSQLVIFWSWTEKKEDDAVKRYPFLKYYRVFNLEQTEGFEVSENVVDLIKTNANTEAVCSEFIAKISERVPEIKHDQKRAFYSPSGDYIGMPEKKVFFTSEGYFSTLFHEIIHSTGHISRLNRLSETACFGSMDYSKEELVAEFGASFLCGLAQIEQPQIENSAAYISGWSKVLKKDKKMIVYAAAQAQKAIDFLVNQESQATQDSE